MRVKNTLDKKVLSGSKTLKVTRKKGSKNRQIEKASQKIRTGLKAGPDSWWP